MLAFDHVLLAVADLDGAAGELLDRHGLASVAGGRHAGHGTENRIVPLGPDYVELVGVADRDEAASSPFGALVAERARAGGGPIAVCLRADDLDGVAARLGLEPLAMGRSAADGTPLRWRIVGLEHIGDGLPFFIRWDVPSALHPGRAAVEHRAAPHGIAWVELGGDPARVRAWLETAAGAAGSAGASTGSGGGDAGSGGGVVGLDLRLTGGASGPHAVGVATAEGVLVLG